MRAGRRTPALPPAGVRRGRPGAVLSGRALRLAPVAAIAAVGGSFLAETALLRAVPVARDVQLFFLPHRHILWSALQRGDLPLWTPLVGTGYPVLADFQSGVFYPPHWLYAALPFLAAFDLLVVFHLVLGGIGAFLLARRVVPGRAPALVAAVCFMLGGYFASLTNLLNVLQTAAWAPLMVVVVLRHAERWRAATLLQALSVYVAAFLAGAPQTFAIGALVAAAAGVTREWGRRRSGPAGPARVLATLAALAVGVAALSAVQILPTLEMVGRSVRAGGLPLQEAARYSLSPVRLLHLAVPGSFGDPVYRYGRAARIAGSEPWLYSVYPGVGALALAWHARRDRGRRRLVALWGILAALGVALALGDHLPLFPWLHAHVPHLASFRYPEKFFLLTGLAVPMLAAHGARALLEGARPDRADRAAALLVPAGVLAAKWAWVSSPERVHGLLRWLSPDAPALEHFAFAYAEWGHRLDFVLGILAAAVALIVSYRKGWLRKRVFAFLLLATVVADLWTANRGVTPTVDPSFYRRDPAILDQVPVDRLRRMHRWRATPFDDRAGKYPDFGLPTLTAKWYWQQTLQPVTAALRGIQGHGASDAIHLESAALREWLFAELPPERRVRLLRLGSVSHVYAARRLPELEEARVVDADSVPGVIHVLDDPIPRAYLARARFHATGVAALNHALRPGTDPRREVALVTPDAARLAPGPGGTTPAAGPRGRLPDPGAAALVADDGETVRIEVRPRAASYLVLTDTWYPGWEAHVDGERRPVRRANGFFRAVRVRPGDREVVFRYRPASFRAGRAISGASLLLLGAGLVAWRRRSGRRESGRP